MEPGQHCHVLRQFFPGEIYTIDYNKQEGAVTNKRVCTDYAQDDSLGLWDVCGCAGQGLGGWVL